MYIYTHTIEAHLHNQFCYGKAIIVKHYECAFVALVIQHAICVCLVMVSSVTSPTLTYLSILPHTQHNFLEKVIEHKMNALISLQLLSETSLILRQIQSDTTTNIHRSSYKM